MYTFTKHVGISIFSKMSNKMFLPISSAYTNSIFSVSNTKQEIGCHMIKVKCDVTSIKKYIQISVFMVLIEMTDLNIDIQIENEKKPIPQTPSNIGTTVR